MNSQRSDEESFQSEVGSTRRATATTTTFCSVLNVVIDHTMEDPTPLERREWSKFVGSSNKTKIQVPVVRVFGPLLKGGSKHPRQTSCLYIHGAFPYLLARPVIAGPDGSLRRAKPPSGTTVDWDDVESVDAIKEYIGKTLEEALQSLETNSGREDNNHNHENKQNQQPPNLQPFIRQITVVEGRGFYSYCPGPSAPFLKVEYYNPKLRWKIKMILERGLEVSLKYHPDPTIYDRPREGETEDQTTRSGQPLLKFNCYEAHIPYTMQFFKDQNLAGMSYIHLSNGFIRGELPKEQPSWKRRYYRLEEANSATINEESIFLQSNTPKKYVWSTAVHRLEDDYLSLTPAGAEGSEIEEDAITKTDQNKKLPTIPLFDPPKKYTSTDVEIDCTVDDIRNVETVLKTMPSDQYEQDQILWRAVPSLEEIWKQERRRMSKLFLPPKTAEEVLSTTGNNTGAANNNIKDDRNPISFTLNPKNDKTNNRRSNEQAALKGMWSLVGLTEGLTEDFLRSVNDIIQRHKQAIEKADKGVVDAVAVGKDICVTRLNMSLSSQDNSSSAPDLEEAIEALAGLAGDGDEESNMEQGEKKQSHTPDLEDTIMVLGCLADTDCHDRVETETIQSSPNSSPDSEDAIEALGSLGDEVMIASQPSLNSPESEEAIQALGHLADNETFVSTQPAPSSLETEEAIEAFGYFSEDKNIPSTQPISSLSQGMQPAQSFEEAIGALGFSINDTLTTHPTPNSSTAKQGVFDSPPESLFGDEESDDEVALASPGDNDRDDKVATAGSEDNDSDDEVATAGPSSSPSFTFHNGQGSSQQQSFSFSCSQEMQDSSSAAFDNIDLDAYCQRLERGDGIIDDTGHELEDYIDPETLRPYDELYFGKERCRILFRVDTDADGTYRVCGGSSSSCTRHSSGFSSSSIECANAGYYKTVSSGAFVDGLHEGRENDHPVEDDEDVPTIERWFLEAQTQEMRDPNGGTNVTHHQLLEPQVGSQFLLSQHLKENYQELEESSAEQQNVSDDDENDAVSIDYATNVDMPLKLVPNTTEKISLQQHHTHYCSNQAKEVVYPASIAPRSMPPTRKNVSDTTASSVCLHPKESLDKLPSWLNHSFKYSMEGLKVFDAVKRSYFSFGAISIQTSRQPPNRSKVLRWCQQNVGNNSTSNKRARPVAEARASSKRAKKNALEIDSNSRKLVAKEEEEEGENLSTGNFQGQIENASWEQSQPWQLSMTQLTQCEHEQAVELQVERHNTHEDSQATSVSVSLGDGSQKTEKVSFSNEPSSQNSENQLEGIGNQGGRIHVQGGGGLKAKTTQGLGTLSMANDDAHESETLNSMLPSPISFMSIEIHVQSRTGTSRLDSKKISMAPDSSKDKVCLCAYIFGIDPGGGQTLEIIARGCLFVPLATEKLDREIQMKKMQSSMPRTTLGASAPFEVECVSDERQLLLRIASLVRVKDPDMLLSWDTQGAGLGYLIERGEALASKDKHGNESNQIKGIDLVKLLGRTPTSTDKSHFLIKPQVERSNGITGDQSNPSNSGSNWTGSGLGSDWDERVGAGAAASSIVGRLVFAGWKIVAEEVKHPNASYLPAIVAVVLGRRIPHHDELTLTRWYASETERWRVLNHKLVQAYATLLIFDALDVIGRAGEAARLSGVEFSQSFPGIRGSQYKVEGVLLRALQSLRSDERGSKKYRKGHAGSTSASPTYRSLSDDTKSQAHSPWKLRRETESSGLESRHYFFYSPSLADTNKQEALEVQALTLEPQSGHYKDPVVVCDFTALYPSLVIAYNLCYSTCVGKLEYHSTRREMRMAGRTCGKVGPMLYPERRSATVLSHHLKSLENEKGNSAAMDASNDRAYIAPTGCMYVSENVLKGVLPQVLDEMLTTRAMLKRAAKAYKKHVKDLSPAILRQLEARQLALKYVANVTYGYTSATFSGRCAMPLLADTIVECGRKTLRKAINLANKWGRENPKWIGSRVIYGDTDSLFVHLPGRSHLEAFEFGEQLCKAVTADNPPPVELKLEKVYTGSIMQTMKRYCGMKFESKGQKKPVFEAKGLETVRRDQCALTQKVLRNALITLFRDGVDAVKDYLFRQWSLIFSGQLPVSDFVLTGRVRSRYRGGREGPVQAVLARRIGEADPGRIIRHKERLPYVIVATPGVNFRLKDCVLTPLELLERWDAYSIHSAYYIEKHVNASLQRCLGLAPHQIDVNAWYQACPKPRRRIHFWPVRSKSGAMITSYFGSDVCSLCNRRCSASGRDRVVICPDCRKEGIRASQSALLMLNEAQELASNAAKECSKCNQCFEDSFTFAAVRCDGPKKRVDFSKPLGSESLQIPLSNCVCIDCPNTYLRHRLREREIEAVATCKALGLL